MTRVTKRASGFTLVELLVVIGIIALLISILLPALNRARAQANTARCLSNIRSCGQAAMTMAAERRGVIQTVSSAENTRGIDPTYSKFVYRDDLAGDGKPATADFASGLSRFMGARKDVSYNDAIIKERLNQTWRCPSDVWQNVGSDSGYQIFFNVSNDPGRKYFPVSYGINADIACISVNKVSFLGNGANAIYPVGGPPSNVAVAKLGQALQARLDKVYKPAEVALFTDCGVRPDITASQQNPADGSEVLVFTSNYMTAASGITTSELGTMAGAAKASWLGNKFPWNRHASKAKVNGQGGGKLNVCFADGHAETVDYGDIKRVRISPYNPSNYK